MAILAAIASPSFNEIRDKNRVRVAAEAVYAHLQFARFESIKQNRNLYVAVKPGDDSVSATWCLGISNASGCNCAINDSCVFGPTGNQIESNISSSSFSEIYLQSNKSNIEFDSRRGTNKNNGTIVLTGSNALSISIVHSRNGRIRLCSNNVGGYPKCNQL